MNSIIKSFFFVVLFIFMLAIFLSPIFVVLSNSLTTQTPSPRLSNYYAVFFDTDFLKSCIYSVFITIFSTALIVFFSSMTAWMIIRVKNKLNKFFYYCFVFSAFVPFAALMWTMPKTAELAHLNNPIGIILLYLGFGAGTSILIFSAFIKKIPVEIEEAALLDGCSPIQIFSNIVFPIIRPAVSIAALFNVIWIYNDYLMPNLIIGASGHKTIPMSIMGIGGSAASNIGILSAAIILSIIPILIFYIINRRNIIKTFSIGIPK
ncbi:MAG: carbohydrate ABC transporter permease [Elusimicrobiota bacterium]|jgi:raffinose/stachyose/melibiose transport system permease protein|nr:carbohydrate ABC transporter permease [Elusimicrobiota bacterium]